MCYCNVISMSTAQNKCRHWCKQRYVLYLLPFNVRLDLKFLTKTYKVQNWLPRPLLVFRGKLKPEDCGATSYYVSFLSCVLVSHSWYFGYTVNLHPPWESVSPCLGAFVFFYMCWLCDFAYIVLLFSILFPRVHGWRMFCDSCAFLDSYFSHDGSL